MKKPVLPRRGQINVSLDVLHELLAFPRSWQIVGVRHDLWSRRLEILVEGPSFQPQLEGDLPRVYRWPPSQWDSSLDDLDPGKEDAPMKKAKPAAKPKPKSKGC